MAGMVSELAVCVTVRVNVSGVCGMDCVRMYAGQIALKARQTLASGDGIGQNDIKLWDADSGKRIGTLAGQGDDEWTMSP